MGAAARLDSAVAALEAAEQPAVRALEAEAPKIFGVDGLFFQVSEPDALKFRNELGVSWDRYDSGLDAPTTLEAALAHGFNVVFLSKPPTGEKGASLETVKPQLQADVALARRLGLEYFEPWNEPYFEGLDAAVYAEVLAETVKLAAGELIVLAKYWGDYQQPSGEWSQTEAGRGWYVDTMNELLALGQPQITDVAVHPYGPIGATGIWGGGNPSGWGSFAKAREWTEKAGLAPLKFHVTEVGQEDSIGETAKAEAMTTYVNTVVGSPDIAMLLVYSCMYETEWGLYRTNAEPKLAAKAFAAAVKGA